MFFRIATCAIGICSIAAVSLGGVTSSERTSSVLKTVDNSTPRNLDNAAESGVTSYSSVIIHHTTGKNDGDDQEKQASRSESYFKIQMAPGKSGNSREVIDKPVQYRRPSYKSSLASSPPPTANSPISPTHASHGDKHQQRTEGLRGKLRDVKTLESYVSNHYPKVRHFEADFKPIEIPSTEEPKRSQRLVNHRYNPHHYISEESDENSSHSNEQSRELFKNEPKHRDYDNSEERYRSSEEYSSENTKHYNGGSHSRNPSSGHDFPYYGSSENNDHEYGNHFRSPKRLPTPPPGMSEELMETLLSQEPHKFDDGTKIKRLESRKKFKSASNGESPSTFNVGYSIGFGTPSSDDVVVGKPKQGLKLHVNGEKSVWKKLNGNVEMSQDLTKVKPLQYRVPDSHPETKVSVLKTGGSPVFYMNNHSPTIDNVPTVGKSSFDHEQALTNSNLFDFTNAVMGPVALPLQSSSVPETHHYLPKTKSGRQLDVPNLYPAMNYAPPVPVLIPGPKGESQMVHAIVIPLHNIPNIDLGWGQLSSMFGSMDQHVAAGHLSTPVPKVQPSPQLVSIPVNPQRHHAYNVNSVQHNFVPSGPLPILKPATSSVNHHPMSRPYSAIPDKTRTTKYFRIPKDAYRSASAFPSPIIVQPLPQTAKSNLQKELNAVLAQEMYKKNHRHAPVGLRPPPPPNTK